MQVMATQTDPVGPRECMFDDDVVRLREWGSERTYELPRTAESSAEWILGSASTCEIQLVDAWRMVSRRHARLVRERDAWIMHDAGSKNGLWLDNGRRLAIGLSPGVEVGIGSLTLIAESERLASLRALLCRLLGWGDDRRGIIDRALRSLRMSATLVAPLVLYGDGNLVDIARQLHRAAFGASRPFIVCDPRRRRPTATSRSAESRSTLADAINAARGGTVCVWSSRLPPDFEERREDLRTHDVRARLVVCYRDPEVPPGTWPGVVRIPPLSERTDEIDPIVDAYAEDVIAQLGRLATRGGIFGHEREWLRRRRLRSIAELARAVERIVAIRELGTIERASEWLGISRVALSRWLNRSR
jgi:pSer/pThr/pTyr-binding forkhead associated (FHA) protein